MKTVVRQNELHALEQRLKQALQKNKLQRLPEQVQCGLNRETLLILVQHPPDLNPDPEEIFAVLEAVLLQEADALIAQLTDEGQALPIRLQLRIEGHRRPYRLKPLTLQPTLAIAPLPSTHASNNTPGELLALDSPLPPSADLLSRLSNLPGLNRIPTPVLAIGAVMGLLTLGSGLYLLSRPCVVGRCQPMETAQQLGQASAQLTQATATPMEVITAYQNLTEAIYLLSTIPQWSPQYQAAQTLLTTYEGRAALYAQMVSALKQANTAAEKSQNPPHPLSTWREVQQIWREAIAQLQRIPTDSPIYPLAQRKLGEYQTNLVAIDRRLRTEQQAEERVKAAQSVAAIAERREGEAQSADQWQSIYTTWNEVVNALKNVPRGSMAYGEAQQLLALYQPRLAAARDRHTQEQEAKTVYTSALNWAEQARTAEGQKNWAEAIAHWQQAFTQMERVPADSSYHTQTPSLAATYKAALLAARERLRLTTAQQEAEQDLRRACSGTTSICTYTLTEKAIEVRLTSDYDWAVQAVVANAPLRGDAATQTAVRDYVNQLLRLFENASKKAQRPLDLYNSDNTIFSSYDAQLDGFVAR